MISDSPPKTLNNKKSLLAHEDRLLEIEARNRQLFARMKEIDLKPLPKHHDITSVPMSKPSLAEVMNQRTINARRRELERVEIENRKMLERLQDSKPTYDSERWLD